MTVGFRNLLELTAFSKQKIYWPNLPCNIEMSVELVNFQKTEATIISYNKKYRAEGAYYRFFCVFKAELSAPKVLAGDLVEVDFPIRTFIRAIEELPLYRKKWASVDVGNDNAFMKFIKLSRQAMTILEFSRRAESPVLTEKVTWMLRERDYPVSGARITEGYMEQSVKSNC